MGTFCLEVCAFCAEAVPVGLVNGLVSVFSNQSIDEATARCVRSGGFWGGVTWVCEAIQERVCAALDAACGLLDVLS